MKFTYFAGRYFAVEGLDEHTEIRNFYGGCDFKCMAEMASPL